MALPTDVVAKLRAPFNPEDISWKPQTVNYSAKTALAVAYADPRAYIDRLNEAIGVGGWSDQYHFIATPFTKFIKGKKAWKDKPATEDKTVEGNKLIVTCTISVMDPENRYTMACVSSTGDCDASDDNAATGAEAQAFKRAAMKLGLGRYLYDLPKITAGYDNGWTSPEQLKLPDWALPKYHCAECKAEVKSIVHGETTFSVAHLLANSQRKWQKDLCAECQRNLTEATKAQLGRAVA